MNELAIAAVDGKAGPGGAVATTTGIETCDSASGLATINDPGAELVVWRRKMPEQFCDWLDHMDASRLPSFRILVEPRELQSAIEPLLDDCDMPVGEMRDLLVEDVNALVSDFAKITRSTQVDVRLEAVSHDSCWKFHRDNVEARLLTTYRGPATEWVLPPYAEQAIDDQRDYAGPLERLERHHVAIFKGCFADPNRGIVHRSPPISGSGRTRLMLCLNKRTVTSPDPWVKAPA